MDYNTLTYSEDHKMPVTLRAHVGPVHYSSGGGRRSGHTRWGGYSPSFWIFVGWWWMPAWLLMKYSAIGCWLVMVYTAKGFAWLGRKIASAFADRFLGVEEYEVGIEGDSWDRH